MSYSKYLNDNFLAFAHRGGNDFGPENSLKSFLGAYEIGYKYLETDVHLSKDGHLVAFHDESLDRVTNKTGLIKDLKLSDIKKAKIDNSEEIASLIELLDNIPNCFFNIDCKSDDTVVPLIEVIKKFSLLDRVCIGSFSQKRIKFSPILTVKTRMIVKKSRPLSCSGSVWRQPARVNATFSRS